MTRYDDDMSIVIYVTGRKTQECTEAFLFTYNHRLVKENTSSRGTKTYTTINPQTRIQVENHFPAKHEVKWLPLTRNRSQAEHLPQDP